MQIEKCDNNKRYYCSTSTFKWIFQEDCSLSGATCNVDPDTQISYCKSATTCVADTEQRCNAANQVETCNSAGTGFGSPVTQCSSSQDCVYNSHSSPPSASCQPKVSCPPGALRCDSTSSYSMCNAAGNQWNPSGSCAPGTSCVQSTPTTIICQGSSPTCTNGQDKCDNNKIYYCQSNAWIYQEDCTQERATCTLDSVTNTATCVALTTCVDNEQRCNAANQIETCQSNGWGVTSSCGANEQCVYAPTTKTASCQAKVSCAAGTYRCDSDSAYSMCNANGNAWIPQGTCATGQKCTAISGGMVYCASTSPCVENSKQCKPGYPQQTQICANGQWVDSTTCPSGQVCSNGACVASQACVENALQCKPGVSNVVQICRNGYWMDSSICSGSEICQGDACVSSYCTNGAVECVANTGYICQNNDWTVSVQCTISQTCTVSGGTVYCATNNNGNNGGNNGGNGITIGGGGSSGGITIGGGTSGGNSGGGNVAHCSKFTDWYSKDFTTYTEKSSDGRSRDCKNVTEVRWCYGASGSIDYSQQETRMNPQCGEWNEQCDYAYDHTENYVDKSGNNCRSCADQVYVLKCLPSGKTTAGNIKKQSTCTDWKVCNVSQLAGATAQTQGSSPSTSLDSITSQYGTVIGVVLAGLVLVVAYTGWKMFTAKPE